MEEYAPKSDKDAEAIAFIEKYCWSFPEEGW